MASQDDRNLKRFNGEEGESGDAGKQLRKFKNWCQARMATMKDFTAKQQGPFIYTLLEGKALEAVEHLDLEDLMKEDGAKGLWEILRQRFPEKESEDQMGEALGEVFGLSARDGESMQQWSSRVAEVFARCKRKAAVEFPSVAQGWIALNCAGLSEEQKAIAKAKSQGRLELEVISASMRSCFPQFRAAAGKTKKPVSTFVAEPEVSEAEASTGGRGLPGEFEDVEAFLADHDRGADFADYEQLEFETAEAAEALAVSWKERRQEIQKLHQTRRFNAVGQAKKSFRVEIEELKKRTRCRKCNKVGHWARECRAQVPKVKSDGPSAAPASSSVPNDVHFVQQDNALDQSDLISFVGMAQVQALEEVHESLGVGLVSSPGFGVVDSGCGRTLIGAATLAQMLQMVAARTPLKPTEYQAQNTFRFGNGATEVSNRAIQLPVCIGGRTGVVDAAIIAGQAPLLLGRPTLEKLRVCLNFVNKTMRLLEPAVEVPMVTNQAGQLLINVLDFPAEVPAQPPSQVHTNCHDTGKLYADGTKPPDIRPPDKTPQMVHRVPKESLEPKPTSSVQDSSAVPPPAPHSLADVVSRKPKRKVTLKPKECRCLLAQVRKTSAVQESQVAVAELFSPPRVSEEARAHGATGIAFGILQGCDLEDPQTQQEVSHVLDTAQPALLVCSPPCKYWGGWEHLNRCYRTAAERARLVRSCRRQVRYCVQQIHRQIKRGGDFLFEHPLRSQVWKTPEMQNLKRKYGFHVVDMCAYGLKCPKTHKYMKKESGLICSNPAFAQHVRRCPGSHEHVRIEGSIGHGVSRSAVAGRYAPGFVRAVWESIGLESRACNLVQSEPIEWDALQCECLAASEALPAQPQDTAAIDKALKKLHVNLGHPSAKELVRVLKHSRASQLAVDRVAHLECSVCSNHIRPAPPVPAKVPDNLEFNDRVGLDVKYLPGWQQSQKLACVNLVDYATSLQIMIPIGKRETGPLLVETFRDHWISWAGPPKKLVLDPAQPNLSETFNQFCTAQGVDIEQTAAEAHWQLGKVERHGQWFARILAKTLDEMRPTTEEDWRACVTHTQSAKNALITEAGASPHQLVFGRSVRVPTDLLQEDPHLGAIEVESTSVGIRAGAVRLAARKAVLECHDDRALRAALRARPRVQRIYRSGDWVYYWRTQKYIDGERLEGGQWFGAAMVLGSIGKNIVVAHKKSLLRCAPEQLRPATKEEKTVAEFPHNELLGIRNLLERGQFPRNQFVDLVPQAVPPDSEIPNEESQSPPALTAAECLAEADRVRQVNTPSHPVVPSASESDNTASLPAAAPDASEGAPASSASSYGPVRRITRKTAPDLLHRPAAMQEDDFVELMQEMVPRIMQEFPSSTAASSSGQQGEAGSPRGPAQKREASRDPSQEPPTSRAAVATDSVPVESLCCTEVLSCEQWYSSHVEALMASFLQKKMQKELPVVGNEPQTQEEIDQAKGVEWETVSGKNAVRVWHGQKAKDIKAKYAHRFVGSRFVVTRKTDEEGSRIKARLCLQGHLDPDFEAKIRSGLCHSPTLSQLGRAVLLQLLVSNHWTLQLGDVKGAFMEAGPLDRRFTPLFAHQPAGGVPGLPSDSVIEVTPVICTGPMTPPSSGTKRLTPKRRPPAFAVVPSTTASTSFMIQRGGCVVFWALMSMTP